MADKNSYVYSSFSQPELWLYLILFTSKNVLRLNWSFCAKKCQRKWCQLSSNWHFKPPQRNAEDDMLLVPLRWLTTIASLVRNWDKIYHKINRKLHKKLFSVRNSSLFNWRTIAFVIWEIDFTAKHDRQLVLQVTYFVIRCEAKFSKRDLKRFSRALQSIAYFKCNLSSQQL